MTPMPLGEMYSDNYRGTTYSAKGRLSPQGGFAGEYRIGLGKDDPWIRCGSRFDSLSEALEGAKTAARAAIDELLG